jgi:hypothetical protein
MFFQQNRKFMPDFSFFIVISFTSTPMPYCELRHFKTNFDNSIVRVEGTLEEMFL